VNETSKPAEVDLIATQTGLVGIDIASAEDLVRIA